MINHDFSLRWSQLQPEPAEEATPWWDVLKIAAILGGLLWSAIA